MTQPAYSTRFDEAVALAVSSFRHIYRKGSGAPYVTHLLAVTAIVGENGGDEDQMCAAILHDYMEDVPDANEATLRAQFGDRVVDIVIALSDTLEQPKPPWQARKEAYLATLATKSADVKLVSAADKLHNCSCTVQNLRAKGLSTFDLFNGKREGTLWYYRQIVEKLSTGWSHPLLDRLSAEVDAMHAETERLLAG
ncbi:MAG: HD domain-containing protein [Myxococcota bacterium]